MPARTKEPPRYIAAIKPLSGYVALLREAIAHNDQGAIHDLLEWKVCDCGAFKFPHEKNLSTTGDSTP